MRFTWCAGGLAVWMFMIEVFTGILLAFHYVPSLNGAYPSIQVITHVAPYGFFIRNLHYWCGQMMVVLVVLHIVRVFVTQSFAPPRHFNWIVGLALFIGTLVVDFTGYLLLWDDRSLWAWTIARNLSESAPLIGSFMATLLFGPPDPSDLVLVRIYAWHAIIFPAILMPLIGWHFWRIRKDRISIPL